MILSLAQYLTNDSACIMRSHACLVGDIDNDRAGVDGKVLWDLDVGFSRPEAWRSEKGCLSSGIDLAAQLYETV